MTCGSGLGSGDTGHLQADHSCSAPGCHAHLGRLPGLGGNLGGVGAGSSATRAGRRCWRGGGGKVGGLSPPHLPPPGHLRLYNWLPLLFHSSYLIPGERRGGDSSVGEEAAGEGQGEDRVSDRKEKLIKKGHSEGSEPGQWSAQNQPAAANPP